MHQGQWVKCQAFQPAPPLLRPGVRAIAAWPSRIRLHAIGPTGPGHSIRCLIIIHDKTVPDIPLALFNTVCRDVFGGSRHAGALCGMMSARFVCEHSSPQLRSTLHPFLSEWWTGSWRRPGCRILPRSRAPHFTWCPHQTPRCGQLDLPQVQVQMTSSYLR